MIAIPIDSLTVTAVSAANGTVTINPDGTLNYIPNADFNGTDSVSYTISDGNGGTITATVTVTVNGVNDAPVAINDSISVSEDSTNNIVTVLSNDSDLDGDSLTVTTVSAANGTVTINSDGTLNYRPNANFNGTDTINYTISDGNGGTATATVTVSVGGVSDAPIAVNDTATVNEDSSGNNITVLGNDSDPDGDSLTVTTVSAVNGTVTINPDGTLNYIPNADFNGTDSINYTISDGNGGTATATVTVTVNGVNDAPIAANSSAVVMAGSNGNTINVLDNSSDIDGDNLTVTAVSASNGTVTINADGSVNYIPNANFNGTDTITYTISDGNGGTVTATVTVTVDAVNRPPIAINDGATVTEGSADNNILVLNNDSDPDGDTLTVSTASSINGTVTINSDGTLNYTPNTDFSGTDTLTYTISDGNGGTATAIVTVDVIAVINNPPIAVNDSVAVSEDSSNNIITVLSNDSDPDGDTLTVTTASAVNGTVTINAEGALIYTPNTDFSGTDTITYTISDGNGGTATATVTIAVTAVNDPPVAEDDFATTEQEVAVIVSVLANDSDADGDALVVTTVSSNFGTVVINADNSITFTPNDLFVGEAVIDYSISDGNGGVDSAQVHIVIETAPEPINNPPVAVDDVLTVTNFDVLVISVLDNDFDPDGDAISLEIAETAFGSAVVTGDTITFTPEQGLTGEITINYSISDELGAVATATVIINIDVSGPGDHLAGGFMW